MPIQSTVSDEDFGEDYDFLKPLQQITTEHVQLIPAACFLWWPYSSPSQQTDVQAAHKNAPSQLLSSQRPEESNSVNMAESTHSFTISYELPQPTRHYTQSDTAYIRTYLYPFPVLHQPLHVEWYFCQVEGSLCKDPFP